MVLANLKMLSGGLLLHVCLVLFCLAPWHVVNASHVVSYLGPPGDNRYYAELLGLALQSTQNEYGIFVVEAPNSMSRAREIESIQKKQFTNAVAISSHLQAINHEDLTIVPVPVMRGIFGYRVCFTSPKSAPKVNSVKTLDDLKTLSFGQGRDWTDADILKQNGFKVVEVGYRFEHQNLLSSLYKMVAAGRMDVFCRGVNEILNEREIYNSIENIELNTTFAIRYDMPFFFYLHKDNHKLKERLTKGLQALHDSGELESLWRRYVQESLDYVKLDERKVYSLESPSSEMVDFDYRNYLYNPHEIKEKKLLTQE